jgi:hypothetical protein
MPMHSVITRLTVPAALAALLLTFSETLARADDNEVCFASSGTGQQLRKDGKLVESRAQFELCARSNCPSIVTRNCTQWLSEVSAILPSVTLNATDASGRELIDVSVMLDGKPLVAKIDGKAVSVNPGVHVFTFQTAGVAPAEEKAIVSEGDKAKRIVGHFPTLNLPKETEQKKEVVAPDPKKPSVTPQASSGLPVGALIVGGVGLASFAVGTVLLISGNSSFPDECEPYPLFSTREDGGCPRALTKEKQAEAQKNAEAANAKRDVGAGLMIGGGALIIAGGVWLAVDLLSNKGSGATATNERKRPALSILPVFGPNYAGAGFSGAFQ